MQSFKLADDIEMYGLDDSFEADAMAENFDAVTALSP